jgi:hypothetical protein
MHFPMRAFMSLSQRVSGVGVSAPEELEELEGLEPEEEWWRHWEGIRRSIRHREGVGERIGSRGFILSGLGRG